MQVQWTVGGGAERYVDAVADRVTGAAYEVTERFVEGADVFDLPDHVIRVDVHGPIVDLIWDTQSWKVIVHEKPGMVADERLSRRLRVAADADPQVVLGHARYIFDLAMKQWGKPRDPGWVWKYGDRWERDYGGHRVGEVHTIAAGLYSGGVQDRAKPARSVAMGTNFGGLMGLTRACHAVDALYAKHVAPAVEAQAVWSLPLAAGHGRAVGAPRRVPFRTMPVTVVGPVAYEPGMIRVRDATGTVHRALREHVTMAGQVDTVPAVPDHGFVCKKCGGASPAGVGYVADGAEAGRQSAGLTACSCGYSQTEPSEPTLVIEVDDTVRWKGRTARWVVEEVHDGGAAYEVSRTTGNARRGGQHYVSQRVSADRIELVRKGNATDDAVAELLAHHDKLVAHLAAAGRKEETLG